MCETSTCQFCICGQPRIRLTDGKFAHEFTNPEKRIAWCEPCSDSAKYEAAAVTSVSPVGPDDYTNV
jgi:hypothetical protein